jgi:hypothetical protein
MSVPERYRRYAQPGQPAVQPAEIELYDEADPIVHVPDPYDQNRFVKVRRSALQPISRAEPRDLTPQPLFDPQAQKIFATGVGTGIAGAGVGWGIGQAAAGIATIGGTTAVVAMLVLWLVARAGRPSVHVRQEVHNHASWFGRNTTNL